MKKRKIPIGMRTLKTVTAVILAMVIVDHFGTSSSKLIFAMLGAMAAMQPTLLDSLKACVTDIVGVLFGALMGVVLLMLPMHPLARIGIGMIAVICVYNGLRVRFSPSLPCFIVVMLCTWSPKVKGMVQVAKAAIAEKLNFKKKEADNNG